MSQYASGTTVPISRSREEVEKLLKKYGASGFAYGDRGGVAIVLFEMQGRRYRMELKYPPEASFRAKRTALQAQTAYEAEQKRMWRALVLVVKAKLEAVKSGITTIEDEFLAHTVMANDQTVKEWVQPQIKEMYESGHMPSFLPGLPEGKQRQLEGPIIEGEVREE